MYRAPRFNLREPERRVRGGETEYVSLLIRRQSIDRAQRVSEIAEELRNQRALERRMGIFDGRSCMVCDGFHDQAPVLRRATTVPILEPTNLHGIRCKMESTTM